MTQYVNVHAGYLEVDELDNEDHHAHEDYVITLLLSGYVTLKSDSATQIQPGTLTLVPSGFPHTLLKGKAMSVHWLSFGLTNEQQAQNDDLFLPFRQIRQGALPIAQVSQSRLPYIITLFEEVQRACSAEKPYIVLQSLINLIISEAASASSISEVYVGHETKVSKAMQFIERRCCEGISLKDVAQAVHLSPAHLTTKMKASTGFTVGQWISKHRLKAAINRLETTDDTIEHIAHKLGWSDVTHFIRQFKKAYHSTPAAWRRRHIANTEKP
ncbi:helix-turn-helix transcriptional regulator [Pseudoalteromonas sp. JBTF-M23]|uniref:Helix-turn-helix transcriptional regulator n=1 Tax=Pseudoalteromonas caenipelagi TaxID=2726988 RepID=A0A849VD68_9GAMM|nr:AraC family transcriptional regulator [Pseudoalteromonas caenipelagi]NOU49874.1 helix-turn-helix transcriptional regulator [Pseudoalteromonas caenipelagi]